MMVPPASLALKAAFTFVVATLAGGATMPDPLQFTLPTTDGRAEITGQFDKAGDGMRIVVLVSGTGFFDRDVRLGQSGTPRDLVFRDLSDRLGAAGISVVRFDKRGIRCGEPNSPACIDLAAVSTISAGSGSEDFAEVFAWARRQNPDACIASLAHSEGMAHMARAVGDGKASPAAIFGIGALMESPATVFRWQRIDRIPESIQLSDLNQDGQTTNEEVMAGFPDTPAGVFGDPSIFLSPTGAYDPAQTEAVRAAWAQYYAVERESALAALPEGPFAVGGVTMASYDWWQQWFSDDMPIARRLRAFDGPIRLFYGSKDSQTPAARQKAAVEAELAGADMEIALLQGVGHTLGRHVFMGPIDEDAAGALVDGVVRTMNLACQAGAGPG